MAIYTKLYEHLFKQRRIQLIIPQNFKVNEAWLGVKLTDSPVELQEGEINVFALMDVASCYVIDQQVVLVSEELMPPIQSVEAMFLKAFSKAFKYPAKLYIPIEESENNGFVVASSNINIPIEYIGLAELEAVLGPLKELINKNFKSMRLID